MLEVAVGCVLAVSQGLWCQYTAWALLLCCQHLQALSPWPRVGITASDVPLVIGKPENCSGTFFLRLQPGQGPQHVKKRWGVHALPPHIPRISAFVPLPSMMFGIGIAQLLWSQQRQLVACSVWQVMPAVIHQVNQIQAISINVVMKFILAILVT